MPSESTPTPEPTTAPGPDPSADTPVSAPTPRRTVRTRFVALVALVLLSGSGYVAYLQTTPPPGFPDSATFTIAEGEGVRSVVDRLAAAEYTRSSFALYLAIVALHDPRELKASTYVFSEPLTVFELATRLTEGDYGNNLVRFTHIEGETANAVASRAAEQLPAFDAEAFRELTAGREGQLFPDTYYVPPDFTAADLANLLFENYDAQLAAYREAIATSPLSEPEVITLASIIEREANSP